MYKEIVLRALFCNIYRVTYRMYDLVKNVIQIFQLVMTQSIWRYQAVGLIGKKGAENCELLWNMI